MTVSAQLKNRHGRVQMKATVTAVTIRTDKPQEWKARLRTTTHIIIPSSWVCNCPTLSLQCFYTSYKHSVQPRRHKRTCLSWAAQRWRRDEAQGHGIAVVSKKKKMQNSFHTNRNVTKPYRRHHSQRGAKNNKISFLFGYFGAKA